MSRRIKCNLPAYSEAWVELPDEWLGEHLRKRDAASRAASKYNDGKITIAAIALCIADDWGGIPGLEGKNPTAWDFTRMPIALMVWLESVVFDDFAKAFTIPKVYSPPSLRGWMGKIAAMIRKRITGGNLVSTR